jgi:hypothetical protein
VIHGDPISPFPPPSGILFTIETDDELAGGERWFA